MGIDLFLGNRSRYCPWLTAGGYDIDTLRPEQHEFYYQLESLQKNIAQRDSRETKPSEARFTKSVAKNEIRVS